MTSSDITEIRIYLNTADPSDTPIVTVDRLEFYKPRNTSAFILFRFDGSYERQWKAAAYMESKALTSTTGRRLRGVFCTRDVYVDTPGHMTLQQLKDLEDMGHEVAIYTGNLGGMTLAQKIERVINAQNWLAENGLGRSLRILAHGTCINFDNESRTRLANVYADTVFCGPGLAKVLHPHTLWNTRYLYWSYFLNRAYHIPESILDDAIAQKGLVVYGAHVDSDAELTKFKQDIDIIVDKINLGGLIPVSVHELITGIAMVGK